MIKEVLKEEVSKVDWSIFNGPPMYHCEKVAPALHALITLEDSSQAESVAHNLFNALGNDHAGVYYPVVLKALDYIITIANEADNKACRICALAMLNDIYYFEPDVDGYLGCTAEELKKTIMEKLSPYSDEVIDF